jgi:YD repeat-containing protein
VDGVDYAKFRSRSHAAVIRVYDAAGKVIETHDHKGDSKEPSAGRNKKPPRSEA